MTNIIKDLPTNTMLGFGQAVIALKEGRKVSRQRWNGKGMFLFIADILDFGTPDQIMKDIKPIVDAINETSIASGITIVMKTADDKLVFGWLASQTDIMATDWCIVE